MRTSRGGFHRGRDANLQALGSFGDVQAPFLFEGVETAKCIAHPVIGEVAPVLSQETVACLGIFAFLDRVAEVRLLYRVEGDDDGVDFGERFVQFAFGGRVGQLDFGIEVGGCRESGGREV